MPPENPVAAADLLDLTDPAVVADPYPHLAALRSASPLAWHSGMGVWLATGHAEAGAVLRDRRLGRVFGPRSPEADWDTFNWLHADSILDSEPPKHTRLRRLVAGAFGRGHVQRLAPRIEELAAGLLADLPSGEFDVLEGYAEPLPVLVIAELLGVPESERDDLRRWSQAIVRMYEVDRTPDHEAQARSASAEFAAYVEELAAQRAKAPGDDLLSDLVQARDGSDRLSAHELVATAVLLLNAGHEASVNGFGNGLHSWLTAPERPQVDVTDDAALARLVEEFLRHDSPLHLFERTAKEPTDIGGVHLEPGDKVAALLGAANRDPAVFADPDRFDPTRDPNPHLAFGAGIHFCIGAPLARLELEVSLRTLLARFPDLEVVQAQRRPTFVLRGFERLVVSPRA
ncbi:cytochrome P450 [Pedococcus aerophilus]|uniref:cytochrome P450 n=1 Tax=Pedococcus aerophilus TaxID=436356 RepID=UPI0031E14024